MQRIHHNSQQLCPLVVPAPRRSAHAQVPKSSFVESAVPSSVNKEQSEPRALRREQNMDAVVEEEPSSPRADDVIVARLPANNPEARPEEPEESPMSSGNGDAEVEESSSSPVMQNNNGAEEDEPIEESSPMSISAAEVELESPVNSSAAAVEDAPMNSSTGGAADEEEEEEEEYKDADGGSGAMDESSWYYMPDSVLLSIFQYFSPRELLTAGEVCRSWNRLSQDELLWKALFYKTYKVDASVGIMPG